MARTLVVLRRYVHEHSTVAANDLLLRSVQLRRDVVLDGTMAWEPYVRQTIDFIRYACNACICICIAYASAFVHAFRVP